MSKRDYIETTGTSTWRWKRRIGRLQIGLEILHHTYIYSSDRWVIYPHLVFDRKGK